MDKRLNPRANRIQLKIGEKYNATKVFICVF